MVEFIGFAGLFEFIGCLFLYYRSDGSQKVARSPLKYFHQATRMDKFTVIKKYGIFKTDESLSLSSLRVAGCEFLFENKILQENNMPFALQMHKRKKLMKT